MYVCSLAEQTDEQIGGTSGSQVVQSRRHKLRIVSWTVTTNQLVAVVLYYYDPVICITEAGLKSQSSSYFRQRCSLPIYYKNRVEVRRFEILIPCRPNELVQSSTLLVCYKKINAAVTSLTLSKWYESEQILLKVFMQPQIMFSSHFIFPMNGRNCYCIAMFNVTIFIV